MNWVASIIQHGVFFAHSCESISVLNVLCCLWTLCFQVEAEFVRITTAPLVSKFHAQLDQHTAQLIKVFKKKGGFAGTNISRILVPITQVCFAIGSEQYGIINWCWLVSFDKYTDKLTVRIIFLYFFSLFRMKVLKRGGSASWGRFVPTSTKTRTSSSKNTWFVILSLFSTCNKSILILTSVGVFPRPLMLMARWCLGCGFVSAPFCYNNCQH